MTSRPPVVFQIGFNRCGTKFISELFSVNGYEARHWGMGTLAEDILYAKATGQEPLKDWPDACLFSDLESVHRYDKPMLEAFKEFRFLHRHFPDALFLLNERDPEAWAASRASHHDGQYIQFHAHHLGLPVSEVPHFWLREYERHIADVLAYFGDSPQLIRYNLDTDTPEDLVAALSPWYRMKKLPGTPGGKVRDRRKKQLSDLHAHQAARPVASRAPRAAPMDHEFVHAVAQHCIGTRTGPGDAVISAGRSDIFAQWDGRRTVLDKRGEPRPLARVAGPMVDVFLARPRVPKLDRIQGVLNDVLSLHRARPLMIDMQDGRGLGADGMLPPDGPLIAYNRRPGARNMVLWPLPGYHTIGDRHFAQPVPRDMIPFEDKKDMIGWRGNLAGRALADRFPEMPMRRASHQILHDLRKAPRGSEAEATLETELLNLTRYEIVTRYMGHRDFDVGFTLPSHFDTLAKASLLARYCVATEPLDWHYGYRYVLSMSGHDTGSNFFTAANSNSLVLKEDDGWELFYTSLFKPWQHYVPLEPGAGDVEVKLDWARENPDRCKEMIAASQALCAKFACEKYRREFLNLTLDSL